MNENIYPIVDKWLSKFLVERGHKYIETVKDVDVFEDTEELHKDIQFYKDKEAEWEGMI